MRDQPRLMVGDRVIVDDFANRYRGRLATVVDVYVSTNEVFVEVPSETGNATIRFNLRSSRAKFFDRPPA